MSTEQMKSSQLAQLTQLSVQEIFLQLESVYHLCLVSRVCKGWHKMSNDDDVWKALSELIWSNRPWWEWRKTFELELQNATTTTTTNATTTTWKQRAIHWTMNPMLSAKEAAIFHQRTKSSVLNQIPTGWQMCLAVMFYAVKDIEDLPSVSMKSKFASLRVMSRFKTNGLEEWACGATACFCDCCGSSKAATYDLMGLYVKCCEPCKTSQLIRKIQRCAAPGYYDSSWNEREITKSKYVRFTSFSSTDLNIPGLPKFVWPGYEDDMWYVNAKKQKQYVSQLQELRQLYEKYHLVEIDENNEDTDDARGFSVVSMMWDSTTGTARAISALQ